MTQAYARHARAFRHEADARLRLASKEYAAALEAFGAALDDPAFHRLVDDRAAAQPDGDARELATSYLRELPEWLVELHLLRARRALGRRQIARAKMHWSLLCSALDVLPPTRLDAERARVRLQSGFVQHGGVGASPEERRQAIELADRLLKVDRLNDEARWLVCTALAVELGRILDLLYRVGRRRERKHEDVSPAELRRMRNQRIKAVRALKKHLAVLWKRSRGADPRLAQQYRQLARAQLSIGQLDAALRTARRARRLDPKSPESRALFRSIRKTKRR